MFGAFRFLLANLVVVAHLHTGGYSGIYAVFSFYVLSGYLITYITNTNYKNRFRSYLLNRFLRIYPTYWIILFITVIMLRFFPTQLFEINNHFVLPSNTITWLKNIFIFGLANIFRSGGIDQRLSPSAMTLNIELIFYLLIPLIARSKKLVTIWFVVSLIPHLILTINNPNFYLRYYPVYTASLPFSVGALIFYYRKHPLVIKCCKKIDLIKIFSLYFLTLFLTLRMDMYTTTFGFYANLFASLLVTLKLSAIDKNTVNNKVKNIDKILGDLSYPIYLFHWQVGVIAALLFLDGQIFPIQSADRYKNYLTTLPILFITCYLMVVIIEKPIYKLRDVIRGKRIY